MSVAFAPGVKRAPETQAMKWIDKISPGSKERFMILPKETSPYRCRAR